MSTQFVMKAGSPKVVNTSEKLCLAPVQIVQVVIRLFVVSEVVGLNPVSVNLSLDLELNPQPCMSRIFNPNGHVGLVVTFLVHMLRSELEDLKLTGQMRLDLNLEGLASSRRNFSH